MFFLNVFSAAVLVLYFKYFLKWDDDFATTIYHTFVALCYLTPILGAIVADSWLGKFKWVYWWILISMSYHSLNPIHLFFFLHRTIIYLSIVYALGQVVLAVSAIHDITDSNKDGVPDNMAFHMWVNSKLQKIQGIQSNRLVLTVCHPLRALSMVGLMLIALGTGGIKPCVAAFGGDQFTDDQVRTALRNVTKHAQIGQHFR